MRNGWQWIHDGSWARLQLNARDGMMLGIVERPSFELWGRIVTIPFGWNWRNCWAGPGRWSLSQDVAMAAAEDGAGLG